MTEITVVKSNTDVKELLVNYQERFAENLPKQYSRKDVGRFITAAAIYYASNPEIHGCTKESLVRSVMQSCELGLSLLPALKLAYMINFKNKRGELEARFMPSYIGLLNLVHRSGRIAWFDAVLIYENDKFQVFRGTDRRIVHEAAALGEEPGRPIGAYAIARLNTGEERFEIMRLAEIEEVRKSSKAPDSPAWKRWWGEMARKTVSKRLCKWLPLEVDERVFRAIEYDNRAMGFENAEVVEVEGDGERTKRLSEKLNEKWEKEQDQGQQPEEETEKASGQKTQKAVSADRQAEKEPGEYKRKLREIASNIGPEKIAALANNLGFNVKLYTNLNETQAEEVYNQLKRLGDA